MRTLRTFGPAIFSSWAGICGATLALAALPAPPHPTANPSSPLMLVGDGVPADPHAIDFDALPRIPSRHAVVSDVIAAGGERVNQHNYLVHHGGRFWAMWSDGPGISRGHGKVPGHDNPGQHVSFATSSDGLTWSGIGNLTGAPDAGFGWIARGFWVRDGKLLALASRYQGKGYPGEGLSLHAFALAAEEPPRWQHLGLVFDDALNNFPPKRLPSGEWMMSRRDGQQNVHFLVGGTAGFDRWASYPAAGYKDGAERPEEPYWWVLPDNKNILALFRDNSGSGFLLRSFSTDNGRTWTAPVRTNFPDAKSKFSGVRLSDGRYVLVSNPHPKRRDPLTLAVSDDGVLFHRMGYLVGGRHVDYPHVIEHDGNLYVAFATAKQTVEVLQVRLADLPKADASNRAPGRPKTALGPMLDLPVTGREPAAIDFHQLPILRGEHTIVTHGHAPWGFRNHSYLAYHAGQYWAMWSQGTAVEDRIGQRVGFATSQDGIRWTEGRFLSPEPRGFGPGSPGFGERSAAGFRYIARGFWQREGELLALASLDEAGGFFGPSLELHAFGWNATTGGWEDRGVIAGDTINNFPPIKLADGNWAMVRRSHERNVTLLLGGVRSPSDWATAPLAKYESGDGFRPEEPLLWTLPGGRVMGLFRDNGHSKRVFRAWSDDHGRSWTVPEKTNFPDATSKMFGLQTSRGWYALISNANPAPLQRNPLCLSLSADGVTFTRMARLPVPTSPEDLLPRQGARKAAGFQYPHAIEHNGYLWVVYSRNMTTIEVIKLSLDDLETFQRTGQVGTR